MKQISPLNLINGKPTAYTIISVTSMLVVVSLIILLLIQNNNLQKELSYQKSQLETQIDKNKESFTVDLEQILKEKEINYFVNEILPRFPSLQGISGDSITDILIYTLEDRSTGWFIVTEDNEIKNYFLVSNFFQKQLQDVLLEDTNNDRCRLAHTVSSHGYIIIAGENCAMYGVNNSIAVYSLSTGEKIKLTGNFPMKSHGNTKGTTSWGTATGDFIGVLGMKNPQIVVSYWGDIQKRYSSEVRSIAYFDLQTGKLIKVDNFD